MLNKPPIILIDGNCLGARSVFTVGNLSFQEMPTGVIYGFLKEIQTIFEEYQTNRICFFWDSRTSVRKVLFPEYKIKRHDNRTHKEKETWKLAYEQYDLLRNEILPKIGWKNQFHAEGFEADDILCQAVNQLDISKDDSKVIMVTSDEDLYQCLDRCDIHNPSRKGELFNRKSFIEKYALIPKYWADVKMIAGCKSDEVPGISRVGEKTAIKFIKYELPRKTKAYLDIISPQGQKIIARNKPLVTLPFDGTPKLYFQKNEFSINNFISICEKYGMISLLGHHSLRSWEKVLQ